MNLALNHAPGDVQELLSEWPLAFMFNLPRKSTIVVVGAFKGRLIALLANLYPDYAQIIGLEPQTEIAQEAHERLRYYDNIRIQSFGLGTDRTPRVLSVSSPGTIHASMVEELGPRENNHVHMIDAATFFAESDKQNIDLLVMNIEGFEYVLLPYMHKIGVFKQIERLAVQFHPKLKPEYLSTAAEQIIHNSHHLKFNDFPRWTYWENRHDA